VRSDSFHRQNVQRLAGLSCKRELYAGFFPSRSSKFDCTWVPAPSLPGCNVRGPGPTLIFGLPPLRNQDMWRCIFAGYQYRTNWGTGHIFEDI
jgi:hypothetical protein